MDEETERRAKAGPIKRPKTPPPISNSKKGAKIINTGPLLELFPPGLRVADSENEQEESSWMQAQREHSREGSTSQDAAELRGLRKLEYSMLTNGAIISTLTEARMKAYEIRERAEAASLNSERKPKAQTKECTCEEDSRSRRGGRSTHVLVKGDEHPICIYCGGSQRKSGPHT